jgi:hypothetical protein
MSVGTVYPRGIGANTPRTLYIVDLTGFVVVLKVTFEEHPEPVEFCLHHL